MDSNNLFNSGQNKKFNRTVFWRVNRIIGNLELHWAKYENWFNLFFTLISALPITFLTLALLKTGGTNMIWLWALLLWLSVLATAILIRMITRNSL